MDYFLQAMSATVFPGVPSTKWGPLLVLFFLSSSVLAVDPDRRISQYGHTVWRVQDGSVVPGSQITQTKDGYMWLGTVDGLVRFDGVRFERWQAPNGERIPGRSFTALLGSRDGSLWIGTTGGLSRLKDGHLRNYEDAADPWGVNAMTEDTSGTIWVTRYKLHGRDGPLCSISGETLRCFGKEDNIAAGFGVGLTSDRDGNIWFGSYGLVRWRPGTRATTFLDDSAQTKTHATLSVDIAASPDGIEWVAMDGTGPDLGVRFYSGGKWASYVVPGFDGPKVLSHALLFDRQGSLWVGTENDGIYRIHDGVADHYRASDGLSGNAISFFYEDREGNIWVCTDGGLDMFRNTSVISYTLRQGISGPSVNSVLALRDGSIWLANLDGVDVLRKQGGSTLVSRQELGGSYVTTMFEDHRGAVWVGAKNKLLIFQNNRFREITGPDGAPVARNGEVTAVAEDATHNIWILTSEGHCFTVVSDRLQEQALPNSQSGPPEFLATGAAGGVWIGSRGGFISYYHDQQFQTVLPRGSQGPTDVYGLFVDSDSSLLVPTLHGLYRWKSGRLDALTSEKGLPCDAIYTAITDDHGALWLYAQCGLVKVEATEWSKWRENPDGHLTVKTFDALDGAHPGMGRGFQPLSSKGPDGRLWFAAYVMAQVVNPDDLYQNSISPSVFVEAVVADHKIFKGQPSLQIPALTRDLEINYTALSFSVPQKVRFRYLLEGHDPEWQDAGTRRQAFYTNLSPGTYHFRVVACNSNGVWNDNPVSFDFKVLPAYYQTAWFRLAVTCAVLFMLWALYKLRIRQLGRQFEIGLEARVAERTRIARELHDTLLQSFQGLLLRFQSVSYLLAVRPEDAKRRLDDSITYASKAITESRDAVHQLRSTTLVTNNLASDISLLASELGLEHKADGSPEFSLQVEGRPQNLHPIVRDEVYRIVAEALRNAFQHSNANHIEVEIRYAQREMRMRIRDDGKGIDPAIPVHGKMEGHWGLSGMRERAKLLGGNLEVWSELHSGTELELIIPAYVAYAERRTWRQRFDFQNWIRP